jgi:hypothetical protein
MKTHVLRPLLVTAALLALSGCMGFLESAFELTFGPGDIDQVQFDIRFPSVDDVAAFADPGVTDLPGFPSSLDNATLAHLQGALVVQGTCSQDLVVEQEDADDRIDANRVFTLTTCTGEPRCAPDCPADFFGLTVHAQVPVQLLDEAKAAQLKDSLAEVSPDAIVQVRLRFLELTFFQVEDGAEVDVTDHFADILLTISNAWGETVELTAPGRMPRVTVDEPQRFDIDAESDLMKRTKDMLLNAEPISLNIGVSMRVREPDLYSLRIADAGVRVDVQPEFVISALKAATSKL